jgi:hypothetical protein
VYRRSLVRPLIFRKWPKPSPIEEAARKDSAVHVSLSSDSPVKQPGGLEKAPTLRTMPKSRRSSHLRQLSEACPHISEELQRRVITAVAGRRAVWTGLYGRRHRLVNIEKHGIFHRDFSRVSSAFLASRGFPANAPPAALGPHSSSVLRRSDLGRPLSVTSGPVARQSPLIDGVGGVAASWHRPSRQAGYGRRKRMRASCSLRQARAGGCRDVRGRRFESSQAAQRPFVAT